MQPLRPTQSEQYSNSFTPAFQEDVFTPAKFDEDEPDEPTVLGGILTITPAAFLTSFLIAVEGCVVLANLFGTASGASSMLPGLQQSNPHRDVHLVLLEALGIADIVACVSIMVGIWLTRRAMPKLLRRFFDISQVQLSIGALAMALGYRVLLLVGVAPWMGFMMAFDDRANSGLRLFLMVFYMAASAFVVWILVNIVMYAVGESRKLQDRLMQQDNQERLNLLGQAYTAGWPDPTEPVPLLCEATPSLFVCLPLELTVTLYMLVVLIACIYWLVALFLQVPEGGGWAFFTKLPRSSNTIRLEVFLNIVTLIFSLLTLSAMLIPQRAKDSNDPWRARKRVTVAVLLYFVVSTLRFALFFPITGMAIAGKDVCGMYTHSLQDLQGSAYTALPLHCTGEDARDLIVVFLTFLFDGYLIYGVLKLWQLYRAEYIVGGEAEAARQAFGKYPSMAGWGTARPLSYGIAGPTMVS